MLGKILPEIEKYNEVNRKTAEIPCYDATRAERKIELYFRNNGDIIVICWAGERYVYWVSVTEPENVARNEQLYNHIANEKLVYVAPLENVLRAMQLTRSNLEECFKAELKWKKELRRKNEMLANWETPFGHCYLKEDAEKNGAFFAGDLLDYFHKIKERCALRECGGTYTRILQNYAEELEAASEYSLRVQELHALLMAESYLYLSRQSEIKRLYCYCCAKCRELQLR